MPEDFLVTAEKHGLLCRTFSKPLPGLAPIKGYVFYEKHNFGKAERLENLILNSAADPKNWEQYDREIGRLLGYSEEDINAYVEKFAATIPQPT